jgi:hypothetical protein
MSMYVTLQFKILISINIFNFTILHNMYFNIFFNQLNKCNKDPYLIQIIH